MNFNFRDVQSGPKNRTVFSQFVTPVYVDVEYRSIYQTVQFFIQSKTDVLYVNIYGSYKRSPCASNETET